MDDSETLRHSNFLKYLEALAIPFSAEYLDLIRARSSTVYSDFPRSFGGSLAVWQLIARFTPLFTLSISLLESA